MQTRRLARAVTRLGLLGHSAPQIREWLQRAHASRPERLAWRTGLGRLGLTALVMAVAIPLLVVLDVRRTPTDIPRLLLCMAVSGITSVILCAFVRAFARRAYPDNIPVQLGMPMLMTALVISLNVVLLARLMFLSSADMQLLLAFVAFGMSVAIALIWPISWRFARGVNHIELAARRLAAGEYGVRIAEDDLHTEQAPGAALGAVARSINQVAATLQTVARQQQEQRSADAGERSRLVRALSHDLRTPISAIQAMVEAIADGVVADPTTMDRYHQTLRAETRHLATLLDELFELTRLEAGELALTRQRIWLDELLADTVAELRGCAQNGNRRLEIHVAESLPMIAADPVQLRRVLTTLLQHAVRHAPCGGMVLVTIHALAAGLPGGPDLPGTAESSWIGRSIQLDIIHSGEGIEQDHLPYIFEPGYLPDVSRAHSPCAEDPVKDTAEDSAQATNIGGWGLALAARVIAAHGGSIRAVSPLPAEVRSALLARQDALPGDESAGNDSSGPGTLLRITLPVTPSPIG